MKKRTKKPAHFAVCIDNDGYEASLEVGKLYKIIPDEKTDSRGYIRVVDESGKTTAIRRVVSIDWKSPDLWRNVGPRILISCLLSTQSTGCLKTCANSGDLLASQAFDRGVFTFGDGQ